MDEQDGYDEAICPVDFEHEGTILDDEINAKMVRPLPPGAKLHAIDTCFSGTVLDLPFMCRMNRGKVVTYGKIKGTPVPELLIKAFSGMGNLGALTYSFIQAIQNAPKLSYGRLVYAMRSKIREPKKK
ncbi:hypothetical protein L6164_036334 [Bauhinia variegata]|nr:hypothetical protein L6164_036334 [Bauhinia variegata]